MRPRHVATLSPIRDETGPWVAGSHTGTDDHVMLLFESSGGEENGYMDLDTESLRNVVLIDCTPEARPRLAREDTQ